LAANGQLEKKPIWIIVIEGYPRIFTTKDPAIVGLQSGFTFTFPNGNTVTNTGGAVTPPTTPPPLVVPSGSEDMRDWVLMATGVTGQPDRATHHLEGRNQSGTLTKIYPYYDTTSGSIDKIWQIKSQVGNPSDILLVDSNYLYHWITEIASHWSDPYYFKRINRATTQGVPVMPRTFTLGTLASPNFVTIDSAKPNPQNDFFSCTSQPAIELGDFRGVTSGPYQQNFFGDLGTAFYILNTVYRGKFSGFKVRENFKYVKYWGFVYWESQSLISGSWTTTAYSTHNLLRTPGGLTPNFPCGFSYPWWL
jgi:hypothetical protein